MHLNELWIRNPFDQFDKKCHQVCLYVREFEGCGQEVSREINKCPSSSADSIYTQCSCSITRSQSVKQREHLLSPDCRFSINLLNFLKQILADLLSCALRAHVTNCNIWRRPDWCLQWISDDDAQKRDAEQRLLHNVTFFSRDAKSCRCCRYICAIFFNWC